MFELLSILITFIIISLTTCQTNTTFIKGIEITTWRDEVFDDPVDILVELEFNHSYPFTQDNYSISININNSTTKETYDVVSAYTNETIIDNRVARFTWNPRKLIRNNFYEVEAKLYNFYFDHFETLSTKVKKLEKRKETTFYVDSKLIAWSNSIVFFPLGFYTSNISSLNFTFLKQASFNVLIALEHLTNEEITKVFNDSNGKIRVINKIPQKVFDIEPSEEFMTNFSYYIFEGSKIERGFLGYLFYENPPVELIPRILEAVWYTRTMVDFPIYVTINNTARIREYKEIFDIVGISILIDNSTGYQDVNTIWKESSVVRDGLINNKALWNTPSFTDENFNEAELELRTFQWIASGSNGIIFRHVGHENEFSNVVYGKINNIIKKIHNDFLPIIVSSDDINPYYSLRSIPGFVLRQYRYNNLDYFLIINTNTTTSIYDFYVTNSTNKVKIYNGGNSTNQNYTLNGRHVVVTLEGSTWIWIMCDDTRYKVIERYFPVVFIIPIILCVIGLIVFIIIKKKKEKYEYQNKNVSRSSLSGSQSFNFNENNLGLLAG